MAGAGGTSSTTVPAGRSGSRISLWRGCARLLRWRGRSRLVEVESHPYLPEWDLFDFCREQGIVLLAFAPLGHSMEPKLVDDPVITAIAERVHMSAAQVLLSWAAERGTAFLTTSTKPQRIHENFEVSTLPEDAMQDIRYRITANVRFNAVVNSGVPGFIPRPS